MEEVTKKLFLIDAYAMIYRSYYAFIKNPRINSKGENTSAVFGFVKTLEDIIRREQPTHLAVGFDPHGKTFRHEAYEKYKAQREETPEVIRWSVPIIKEILTAYRIPILEVERYEADDVIGTMAHKAEKQGFEVYMVTPDKDYGQLVSEHCRIYRPIYGGGGFEVLGPKEVCEKHHLENPIQVIDLLSIMGDSSDNIPGCPGIGKVYAEKLLKEYGSIDRILEHSEDIKGSLGEKVRNNKEQIEFSKFLATICTEVPIEFNEEDLLICHPDKEKVNSIFEKLEFRSLMFRIPEKQNTASKSEKNTDHFKIQFADLSAGKINSTKEDNNIQLSLWDNATDDGHSIDAAVENILFPIDSQAEKIHSNLNVSNLVDNNYYIIDNESNKNQFADKLSVQDCIAFKLLSEGNNKNSEKITGLCIGMDLSERQEYYYIPFSKDKRFGQDCLNCLIEKFSKKDFTLIGYNLKNDLYLLSGYSIEVECQLFDVMTAHYLLFADLDHHLDNIAQTYLSLSADDIQNLYKIRNKEIRSDSSADEIESFVKDYCFACLELKNIFAKEIEKENLNYLFYQVESPLTKVLADMEKTGVKINIGSLRHYTIELTKEMDKTANEIYEIAGEIFNINSSKKVGEILFDKLQIETGKKIKKTKVSKQYSTSEEVLQQLKNEHPIVDKILYYRGIKKLISTYTETLPMLVDSQTGRIHTSFNQTTTATGRLSSSNPNLQNIPIRDEMGKEIRKVFEAGEDCVFVSADYSQIELRIMAHLSQDKNMIDAFHSGQDIHRATASKVYNVSLEEVTPTMRSKAKTANFGIIYGISTFGLAERMNVARAEAKQLIDDYFVHYPDIQRYMNQSIQIAKEKGYAETLFHRKRYLQDINSHNAVVRSFAERNAINAPIQGTAADIIKIAMVRIHKALKENKLNTKLILQVHDELDFIVPKEELETVKKIITDEMESFPEFSVPLKIEIGTGNNWLEAH